MTPRHCIPLAARAATVLTALAATVTAALGLAATPALADDCPNAALRAQNNSTQLPDCRAYELVSPVFKDGYFVNPQWFTDDGRLAFQSNGNFAGNGLGTATGTGGNQYVAVRSAGGWSTMALSPSGADYTTTNFFALPLVFSPDLGSSVWVMSRVDERVGVGDLYVRGVDGAFTRIGPTANPDTILPSAPGGTPPAVPSIDQYGASDDLSHIIFIVQGNNVYPGTVGGSTNLYEYDANSNGRPRLVGVDNNGQQIAPGCTSEAGTSGTSAYHAISTDGRVVFWSTRCDPSQVWARISATTTIAVSASQCTRGPSDPDGPCNAPSSAAFEGANADGTRVYFTTSQQQVDGDTDATKDLYECDIPSGTPAPVGPVNPCPSLHQVSGTATDANVRGVVRVSDDGSAVYFVATGVLASNLGANDAAAVDGDDNLYVWKTDASHPAGVTTFVGRLDPGDSALWGNDQAQGGRMAQSTDDGRYLVFASYASLIDHGPQQDADTAQDVYRYDADHGSLTRLSTDVDGEGGDAAGQDATIKTDIYLSPAPMARPRRAMTDDGQSVVFSTVEALSPADTNGIVDIYLWHDGRVSLISSGEPSGDSLTASNVTASISPSGRDVYFATEARLTSNDVDTLGDIYDARVGGGFDLSTTPPCAGDACQGGRSGAPSTTNPASSSTGQDGSPQLTPAFSVKPVTELAQRKRIVSTGRVSLSVTTSAPGTLSAQATATIAQRPSTVGSAKRAVTQAGTVSLSLTLSKKARAELKGKRKLTVKVRVGQDNVASARTVSLKLTQPKAAKKKAKRTSSRMSPRHAAVKGGRS